MDNCNTLTNANASISKIKVDYKFSHHGMVVDWCTYNMFAGGVIWKLRKLRCTVGLSWHSGHECKRLIHHLHINNGPATP